MELSPDQAHHVRDVLRLGSGDGLELFDDAGNVAAATITECSDRGVRVEVDQLHAAGAGGPLMTLAAAVPKGDRADWMVEKLSELGVDTFVPLAAKRSVVLPEGRNKRERWQRLATESAKQSRRRGVMQIAPLTPLADVLSAMEGTGWCLSTAPNARPIREMIRSAPAIEALTLFVGPEGGWTDEELAAFTSVGIAHVALTDSILRVETAAIAAAAVAMSLLPFNPKSKI